MNSGLQFTDDSGNPVQLGEMNADGVLLLPYYVELHKIFDIKDITIFVGENWQQFGNLTHRQAIRTQAGVDSILDDNEIIVTHNVDTGRLGIYDVQYAHEVAPGKIVTKDSSLVISGKKGQVQLLPQTGNRTNVYLVWIGIILAFVTLGGFLLSRK